MRQGVRGTFGKCSESYWRPTFAALLVPLLFAVVSQAAAVELRVVDPLEPIYDVGSAREAPGGEVVLMAAPRGGTASAQVVLIGDGAGDLTVLISELTSAEHRLPAEAVSVRYAHRELDYELVLREGRESGEMHPEYGENYLTAYYDRLFPNPRSGADLQPVWVTVRVPSDAPPGTYTGTLRAGEEEAPVEVRVSAWQAPRPSDYVTHVGVVSSHEVLALRYEVEFWSEAHWALIECQMVFLGKLGADELWLHANADLGHGKAMPLIHFTERDDGTIVPDLTVAGRYTELFAEHAGRPSGVIMNYWMGSPRRRERGVKVLVDGEKRSVPRPEEEGGEELWGRVMEGVRELVREQEWPEDMIMLGTFDDQRPKPAAVETWKRIAPETAWVGWTHGKGDPPIQAFEDDEPIIIDGMIIGVYVSAYIPSPFGIGRETRVRARESVPPHRQGGWNQNKPILASGRNLLLKYMRPVQYRCYPNAMMVGSRETGHDGHGGSAGIGFLALDLWDATRDKRAWLTTLDRRHMRLHRQNTTSVIEPGPDGPVSTVRFEMLREGLQETEARCVVERALVEGRLDAELEEEAKALLTKMFDDRFERFTVAPWSAGSQRDRTDSLWGAAEYPQWIELTDRLYELAGCVSH